MVVVVVAEVMKRYILPEALGGRELEGEPVPNSPRVRFKVGRYTFELPMGLLKTVEPEPPPGVYLRGGRVIERIKTPGSEFTWQFPGALGRFTWDELCAEWQQREYSPIPMIPLVPMEPVPLPWRLVKMTNDASCEVWAGGGLVHDMWGDLNSARTVTFGFAPSDARDKARALWTAADQAEAQK